MLRKVAMLALLGAIVAAPAEAGTIGGVMYKDPGCGCCDGHAAALRRAGMDIAVVPTGNDVSVQARRAVPEALRGCHTTIVGGYAVEGHVPVNVVQRMLREKRPFAGLHCLECRLVLPVWPGRRLRLSRSSASDLRAPRSTPSSNRP